MSTSTFNPAAVTMLTNVSIVNSPILHHLGADAEVFRFGGRKPAVHENISTAFSRSHHFRLSNNSR
jgi:hypothetical protein